jgi:hypothetical protein
VLALVLRYKSATHAQTTVSLALPGGQLPTEVSPYAVHVLHPRQDDDWLDEE